MATSFSTNSNDDEVPKWKLARQGIQLLINNKIGAAEALFKTNPESIQLYAGYSFTVFMDAIMTLEDDKLNLALVALKEAERRCYVDNGWLKTMKSKMFGSENSLSLAENLENQIIIADTQVCMAILIFLQQDVSGIFKGGWILRKSWKLYQHTYNTIKNLYKEIVGELPDAVSQNIVFPRIDDEDDCSPSVDGSPSSDFPNFAQSPSNGKAHGIDRETITRLMGAVSFGYGLFHLGVSLLPPSMLKVTNFFGFGGNRNLGIANLMYAREGLDMRAPLATLALLWYHTIVRPFYAIDGSNVQAGVDAALQLIEESKAEYEKSALFLFFKGRVHRLNSNISEALKAFQASVNNSTHREVKILSLHEVGWCYLLRLDYRLAENSFEILKCSSRWSRPFYGYLSVICAGACNSPKTYDKIKEVKAFFNSVPKNTQLDVFLLRRFNYCPSTYDEFKKKDTNFWSMFVFELLYLWNTLPSCSFANIERIIATCKTTTLEPMLGLAFLIQGSCYNILNKYEDAVYCFRECLEMRKKLPCNAEDVHVSAFAAFELGQLLIKTEETKLEGKSFLSQSSSYKDYDFEQRLNLRVHCLVKHE